MSRAEFLELFARNKRKPEKPKQTTTYSLRLPYETRFDNFSEQDPYDEDDTLRVMSPDIIPKTPIQPLSLPEKKYLYNFWVKHWKAFKAAPACQNLREKRLREKFDGYILINIRRSLLRDWNRTFAGGYVSGEAEARQERTDDDLRALTKGWAWLCKETGFKPWPLAIDHEDEDLENVEIDVRASPFNVAKSEELDQEVEQWYIDAQRLLPTLPELDEFQFPPVPDSNDESKYGKQTLS